MSPALIAAHMARTRQWLTPHVAHAAMRIYPG
jgi:hypothetical protein